MRSNGLTAASYRPVADLDPRLADALLLELRGQGIAAYTRPVEPRSMSGFDQPEIWEGALDRLYVDAAASERVLGQLNDKDPDLVFGNDDLTWAQIVAGFDQPMTSEVAPWPADEDIDADEAADDATAERDAWLHSTRVRAERLAARAQDDSWDEDEEGSVTARVRAPDEEEGFVPAPPPPLPKLEPFKQLAWMGLIGGPATLLAAVLFSLALPAWVSVLAVGGFVGGFVTLVATMDNRDDDWGQGNGAVV